MTRLTFAPPGRTAPNVGLGEITRPLPMNLSYARETLPTRQLARASDRFAACGVFPLTFCTVQRPGLLRSTETVFVAPSPMFAVARSALGVAVQVADCDRLRAESRCIPVWLAGSGCVVAFRLEGAVARVHEHGDDVISLR